MIFKPQIHFFKNLKYGAVGFGGNATRESSSNLSLQQRRKKLCKVSELNKEIQMEMDRRDGLTKTKSDCPKNPQIGDSTSLGHKLNICIYVYETHSLYI